MKVKELTEQLRKLDPELDVLCYSEDECLLAPNHGFRVLDITAVTTIEGEMTRGSDGVPSLIRGKTSFSKQHVVLDVTSDV